MSYPKTKKQQIGDWFQDPPPDKHVSPVLRQIDRRAPREPGEDDEQPYG